MKNDILLISDKLRSGDMTAEEAKSNLLVLFGMCDWLYVNEKEPPINIELLAKDPNGCVHLTSWRPAYDIFCCQNKTDYSDDWQWKLI